jgi:hypothetical protein
LKYVFSPVWWDDKDVDRAAFDVRDAREQEIRKRHAQELIWEKQQELEEQRKKDQESRKTEIEKQLRLKNSVRAHELMNKVDDCIKPLVEQRSTDCGYFPEYSAWLNQRFSDHWETFNLNAQVADFGTVKWQDRPLDAIIVKAVIQQKNRMLGKYEDQCWLLGMIDDGEFQMIREPFAVDCENPAIVKRWEVGGDFQSEWNEK